jgi:hypothetical protein
LIPIVKKFLADPSPDIKQGVLSNLPFILSQISEQKREEFVAPILAMFKDSKKDLRI